MIDKRTTTSLVTLSSVITLQASRSVLIDLEACHDIPNEFNEEEKEGQGETHTDFPSSWNKNTSHRKWNGDISSVFFIWLSWALQLRREKIGLDEKCKESQSSIEIRRFQLKEKECDATLEKLQADTEVHKRRSFCVSKRNC